MVKSLDYYDIPETTSGRSEKLDKAIITLKSEFVGLDEIIDQISTSVSAWYITPEVIKRPVVVSLWGMTGTGKTSVVKRLIELLGLSGKSLTFDCGAEANESANIIDDVSEVVGQGNDSFTETSTGKVVNDLVFVFDEFQYARTINSDGFEEVKPTLRPIWNLLDNGILNVVERSWTITNYCNFVEDLGTFSDSTGSEIPLVNGIIEGPKDVESILDALGLFWFDRGLPSVSRDEPRYLEKSESDEDDDRLSPLKIYQQNIFQAIVRALEKYKKGYGYEVVKSLYAASCIGEAVDILREAEKLVSAPKEIDCSRSLVFILGNLDEAFGVEGDMNPDYDADVFYDITSKVTVLDIKEALRRRFRAEQIARLGNSLIKYPTLKRKYFLEIIKKEVDRIFEDFRASSLHTVSVDEGVIELLYSEGVYPVQGVRPVFTTIGTILTPILSTILREYPYSGGDQTGEVSLYLDPGFNWKSNKFKREKVDIIIDFVGTDKKITKTIPLVLGALRDPSKSRLAPITAIHEASHAIMLYYRTGEAPRVIVAVSAERGGFCDTYTTRSNDISSRYDVDTEVMVSMAGYWGESLFIPDKDHRLLGSGMDISMAWETLSNAVYSLGYFTNRSYSNFNTETGTNLPSGLSDDEPQNFLKSQFERLEKDTYDILSKNKELIRELASALVVKGSIGADEFKDLVGSYSTIEFRIRVNSAEELGTKDYYTDCLKRR